MRYALGTIAAIALLAFGPAAGASTHAAATQKMLSFTGNVESVNLANDTFVLRNDQNGKIQEMEFKLDPKTWIMYDHHVVLLGQLARHDQVTVTYNPKDAKKLG